MAFVVPTFNIEVNLWHAGSLASDPPDVVFMGNLSRGERTAIAFLDPGTGIFPGFLMLLLCPKLTPILGIYASAFQDCIEAPAGSGRYYVVSDVDDCAKGFPNEYRNAWVFHLTPLFASAWGISLGAPDWPVPYP